MPHQPLTSGPDTVTTRRQRVGQVVDAIEGELRRLDLWEKTPPPAPALMSEQPFCFDTLTFTQWLQWIFAVRVRLLLAESRPLPESSDIYPMAEHVFEPLDYDSGPLLAQIRRFDELISSGAADRRDRVGR